MAGGDPDRPLLAPAQLFVPAEEFYVRAGFPRIDVLDKPDEEADPCRQPLPTSPSTGGRRIRSRR